MMNSKSNSFLRLIGAAGNEKELIERLVRDLGIKTFLDNADSIVLSQKTKNALEWLNNILYQQGNIPESLSGLTEIPTKTFTQNNIKELELLTIKDHPELLDVDARQFYKLLCLKDVIKNFQDEQDYIAVKEDFLDYEPEQ
ncbi:hypothetical protein R2R35_18410 [Anaerocolumna sp. AGMB13020]|uniref:hypothetical protein n=1 Tax=Anaerocolumna sp. AGMB13020 TaxID=3081750 RepID=UPI0029531D91|nr:hypothetical protein [Anaerocolumna sp. AGMB13020]WOO35754.1 hypothetical protein R2R35_18410 [Anaerocolumna sp. AGMB13020]